MSSSVPFGPERVALSFCRRPTPARSYLSFVVGTNDTVERPANRRDLKRRSLP
jgi:hypothetical protein